MTKGFTINLESMNISKIRSKFKDTDIASLTVAVDKQVNGNLTKDLGNLKSGNHDIGLSLPVIGADDATFQFSFLILNSGFDRSSASSVKQAMDTVSDKAAQFCTGFFGFSDAWDALNRATHWLNNLQFVNCDGAVAGDSFELSASGLESLAAEGRQTGRYPGTNSPWGCGENSLYFVNWSIQQLSEEDIARENSRRQRGAM